MFTKFLQHIQKYDLQKRAKVLLSESQNYDLPLNQSQDARYIVLLIALMSFLAVLASSGNFALNNMTSRWSSGLQNKATIEIPVETVDGNILSQSTIQEHTQLITERLKNHNIVKSIEALSAEDIQELISPWIQNDLSLADIPLPGLISVEFKDHKTKDLKNFRADLYRASKFAQLETHQSWLSDLISFASSLKTISLIIFTLIIAITVTAIATGMRTRLEIHKNEVELLHHIGATDNYIIVQFLKHTLILSSLGTLIGTITGIVFTLLIMSISGGEENTLMPQISITPSAVMSLMFMPVVIISVTAITAHIELTRQLTKMP